MNDLPLEEIPPNVIHLQQLQQEEGFPLEDEEVLVSQFEIGSSPFFSTINKRV